MRRTSRLFALAEALRARRTGVTAEALAERFGVTVRTIYRDLDALRAASLPINAERGRGGGYALDRDYALPPVNFTAAEAALLVAGMGFLAEMRMLPFAKTLGSALDKVRGALSGSSQRELLRRVATVRFLGVPAHAVDPRVAQAVEDAWLHDRVLALRYLGEGYVEADRRVRITGMLFERGETRLNTLDLDKNEPRQLRLDRVVRAEVVRLAP